MWMLDNVVFRNTISYFKNIRLCRVPSVRQAFLLTVFQMTL